MVNENQNSQFSSYFAENKRMMIMLAVLGVLIIIAVVLNLGVFVPDPVADDPETVTKKDFDKEEFEQKEMVDVLPDSEREVEWEGEEKLTRDPFLGPIELVGLLNKEGGESYAILNTEEKRRVIGEGDKLLDFWEVEEITADAVILTSEQEETKLEFD